jgi:hypothetical protein
MRVVIKLRASVQRCPFGLVLEKAHRMDVIRLVCSETMVDARRQDEQIVLLELNTDPVVVFASNVEIPLAAPDISDLFIFVEMLVEEGLDFFFVNVAHLLWRDIDFIPVLIAPLLGKLVYAREVGEVVVVNSQFAERIDIDGAAGIVGKPLVTREIVIHVCLHDGGKVLLCDLGVTKAKRVVGIDECWK